MAEFNPLFLDTGSIEVVSSSRNAVIDYIHFPVTQSGVYFTTLLPDPFLFASQSVRVSNAVNTTSSSLYTQQFPSHIDQYFYSSDAIIGVSSSATTTGVRIGLQRSQNANTAFNIKSPSTTTAFTFACVGTEDTTIFVLPAGHTAINTVYPTHVKALYTNTNPFSEISNTFLVQPETNNVVSATTGSVFYNQFAGYYNSGINRVLNTGTSIHGAYDLLLQPDGKILLIGNGQYSGSASSTGNVIRINPNGTIDSSFNPGTGFDGGFATLGVLQPDGKIMASGGFLSYNGTTSPRLVRINSNGTIDSTFATNIGTGFNAPIGADLIFIQKPDNKIIIGRTTDTFNGTPYSASIRLNTDGTIDTSFPTSFLFTSGSNPGIGAIAQQSDTKLIFGGTFGIYSGSSYNNIVRANLDTTIDTSFNIGTGFNNSVGAIAIQSDGKIIVGGAFTTYSGSTANRIVRLNSNGTIDSSFNAGTGFDGPPTSITIQNDNKIIVTGGFTSYSGVSQIRITRLNSNGTLDTSFIPVSGGVNGNIPEKVGYNSNGLIYVPLNSGFENQNYFLISGSTRISASSLVALYNPAQPNNSSSPLYLLSGSLRTISGSDTVTSSFLPPTLSLWISQSLTANVSNSSNTTFVTVFNTPNLVTGQRYLAQLYIAASSSATTTGVRLRAVTGSEYNGSIIVPTSTTAVAIANSSNGGDITATGSTASPAGNFLIYGDYTFVKGSTNPQVQILSEINTSFVFALTGSVVYYRAIN